MNDEKIERLEQELEIQTEILEAMEDKHRDIAIEIADCKNKISATKGMLILLRSKNEH